MITLHSYTNGAEIMMNIDNAQYITPTTHKDMHGEAKAVVTFSDETCFYVKESLEEIRELMAKTAKHAELIDALTAEISYGNSLSLNQALEKAIEALRA